MLLNKNEIKVNYLYIFSLLVFVASFYFSIITDYRFFIAVPFTFVAFFILNLIYCNSFSKSAKWIAAILTYILYFWLIANKIYYIFFSEYVVFNRAGTINDMDFILVSLLNISFSLNLILLIVSFVGINYSFFKTRYRVKYLKFPSAIIIITMLILSFCFSMYNYEIITNLLYKPFRQSDKVDNSKPITTEITNMFASLDSKVHNDNQFTGIAEGKNLILVQCESLQNVMLNRDYNNQEITPYMNKLIKNDSLYFNNCFTQAGWGNTSDSEFITTNSFYAMPMESVYNKYPTNYYYGLPKILRENGYHAVAYHGYLGSMWNRENFYPNAGIEKFYSFDSYPTDQFIGFGIADKDFFAKTSNYMTDELKENTEKLGFSFIISLTSHTPFNVSPTMSDIKIDTNDEGTMFSRYLLNINYLDSAIESFIQDLKDKDLYDNSIIVFYGDHQGLNLSLAENEKTMSNFLGKPYSYDDMLNVPLIIHIPGLGYSKEITTSCGLIDIMPTLLNLLNIKLTTPYFGEDILSLPENSDRPIGGTALLNRGSFIDKDYIFVMSANSVYEQATTIDRKTGLEIKLDLNTRKRLFEKSMQLENDIKLSNTITSKNILEALILKNEIIIHDVNPQKFVYNINSSTDNYNYIDRLKEAYDAGYRLVNVAVYKDKDEFYISNPTNILNQMTLKDFLIKTKDYPDVYVILSGISDFTTDLFRRISKDFPNGNNTIPEIYSFDDYQEIKIFNMNDPILSLEKLSYTNSEIIDFVTNNKLFAIKTTTRLYNPNLIQLITSYNDLFTYVSSVDDKSKIKFYTGQGINGFYTNELSFVSGK